MTKVTGISFSAALDALKAGHRVCRRGWNGWGMWLRLVPSDLCQVGHELQYVKTGVTAFYGDTQAYDLLPWIGMKTADNKFVPWLASQTDLLVEDWEIVE